MAARSEWLSHESDLAAVALLLLLLLLLLLVCCSNGTEPIFAAPRARVLPCAEVQGRVSACEGRARACVCVCVWLTCASATSYRFSRQ